MISLPTDREALRAVTREVAAEVFALPPTLSVSEWSDANVVLSSEYASAAGRFRTDRVPYMRAIMDTLGDESVREAVFAKSSQVGGTQVGMNLIGYLVDQAPCGVLSVWPTEKLMRAWSTKKLAPMIRDTRCLKQRFPKSKRREAGDSIASKEFPGGYLNMLTAKSTSDLRSYSARVAIAEEIDDWEGDIRSQGDPLELLRARIRTFWNGKLYMVSTPILEGFSRIWSELETSTWQEYHVPCPHCSHAQVLRWQETEGEHAGQYRLLFERDDAGQFIPGTCRYVCEACGVEIEERHKQQMLERGQWIARYPGRAKVGFHINTLYSPLCPWDDIATSFLRAKRSPEGLQTFVNGFLGLPWAEQGEKVDSHFLAKRVEAYTAPVPRGVGIVTAGVDVQGSWLSLVVVGHGAEGEKWILGWKQLDGDPGQDAVWQDLDRELLAPWEHEDGATVRIAAACIDAGYQTERVHRFAEGRSARKIIATVGRAGRGKALLTAPGPDKFRRSRAQKRPTHVIGVDSGKDLVASILKRGEPGPGYLHFSDQLDPVFFEQLTAEKLVTRYRNGRPAREWVLLPDRRNEALDCVILAEAALVSLGAHTRAQLAQLAQRLTQQGEELTRMKETGESAPAPTRRTPPRRPWRDRW